MRLQMKDKTLGKKFSEQTPEEFWQYAKDIAKHQGIKKPEAAKPKTRKAPKTNGKSKPNTRSKSGSNSTGEAKADAQNLQNGGWSDESGDKFLFTFPNQQLP